MTPAQAHRDQRRAWFGTLLLGVVMVCLAAAFFLLEKQRIEKRRRESVALGESVHGEVIAATFLTKEVTADHLDFLEQYPRIESLTFSNTRSVEGGMLCLRRFGRLKTVDVSRTDWVDATVLKEIAGLPHLQYLSLANSNVDDAALSQLAASRTLEALALDNCDGITDASIDTLQQIATLREVRIEGTRLTLEGFERLRSSRQDLVIDCEIEQFLRVDLTESSVKLSASEHIGTYYKFHISASADEVALLLRIPHNWWSGKWGPPISLHDVRDLSVAGPSPVESTAVLAPRLGQLHRLSLPAAALAQLDASQVGDVSSAVLTDVTSTEQLTHLANMPLVQNLSLDVTAPLEADALPPDFELPQLASLTLEGPGVDDAAVRFLSGIAAPARLYLELHAPLRPETLQDLAGWRRADHIRLKGQCVDAALIRALSQLSALRSLSLKVDVPPDTDSLSGGSELLDLPSLGLQGPGVNDAVVRLLSRTTAPVSLDLAVQTPLSESALKDLAGWRQIRHISLRGPGVSDVPLGALAQMIELESLDLEVAAPLNPNALQPLSRLPKLAKVSVEGPGVNDALVASLAEWSSLKIVAVRNAPVTDAAFVPFFSVPTTPDLRIYQTSVSPQMLQRLRETKARR